MNHDLIKDKLFEYMDNELDEVSSIEITNHLEGCNECKGLVANYSLFKNAASLASTHEPPVNLANNIMVRIKKGNVLQGLLKQVVNIFSFKPIIPKLAYLTSVIILIAMIVPKPVPVDTQMLLLAGIPDQTYYWAFSDSIYAESSFINSLGGY